MDLKRLALFPAIAALTLLPALVLVLVATPATALASCMQPPPIEQALNTAEIVFVGTVTSTANHDSWATVQIDEIWKGPNQSATVVVKGGPDGNAATSVDRTFQAGVKYIFFPYLDGVTLADNACTSTTPWSDGLIALRPSNARAPLAAAQDAPGLDLGGIVAPLVVALLVAGVLLLVGLAARGRQSA